MLLGTTCVICGIGVRPGRAICETCGERLEPAEPITVPGLDEVCSVLRFDGAGRELLLGLKYRNRRGSVDVLASAMVTALEALEPAGLVTSSLVTWAPTSARRRRARGFDQAELLARAVARRLGRPLVPSLRRTSVGPQTGLDARRRLVGPTFRALRPIGGPVLIVDDVVTTGATLAAAAETLRAAGATRVNGVTVAATPLKVGR